MGAVSQNRTPAELPLSGLVAHYDASNGVQRSGSNVNSWDDLSGNGNHLNGKTGTPIYVSNLINGKPGVYFNGNNTIHRVRTAAPENQRLNNFPLGNSDRTMFLVCSYGSGHYGGLVYGDSNSNNKAARLIVGTDGTLMFSTTENENGNTTGVQGNGAGWLCHSMRHIGSSFSFTQYKNNQVIQTSSLDLNTGDFRLTLASDVDMFPRVQMSITLALIYNRALSDTELAEVQEYVEETYGIS